MKAPFPDIKKKSINLVPVLPEQWGLVEEWLAHPVAREFWFEDPEYIIGWLRQIVDRGTGEVLIIERFGEAIGVVTWEWCFPETDPEPEELRKLLEPGTISCDVLIPDARHRNRGHGLKALQLLEHRLWAVPGAQVLCTVVRTDNSPITRILEFMGLHPAGSTEEPGVGSVTLYLKRRAQDGP